MSPFQASSAWTSPMRTVGETQRPVRVPVALPGVAAVEAAAEGGRPDVGVQAGHARPGLGRAEGAGAGVAHPGPGLERVVAEGVQAGEQVGLVAERPEVAVDADAVLVPGGGDDEAVHQRPVDAVEEDGLVVLVQEAHRDEHVAHPQRQLVEQREVEVGELDPDLPGAVLELDLRVEDDPVVEAVADVEDEAQDLGDVGAVVGVVRVDELAVAADGEPLRLVVHLGGAHAHAGVGAERDDVGDRHLELQAADLLGQRLHLGLGGGAVVGGGRRGGRAGARRRADRRAGAAPRPGPGGRGWRAGGAARSRFMGVGSLRC